MLSIILIVLLGRYFYRLAEEFNQNRWLYAVLGVISYYVGSAVGGLVIGFADMIFDLGIDFDDTSTLIFIAVPFGLGAAFIFYFLLTKKWKKEVVVEKDEIQDIGRNVEDS